MGIMEDMFLKAVKSLDSVEKRLDDIEEKLEGVSGQNNQLTDLKVALAEIRGELKGIRGKVELNVNADSISKVDASSTTNQEIKTDGKED